MSSFQPGRSWSSLALSYFTKSLKVSSSVVAVEIDRYVSPSVLMAAMTEMRGRISLSAMEFVWPYLRHFMCLPSPEFTQVSSKFRIRVPFCSWYKSRSANICRKTTFH